MVNKYVYINKERENNHWHSCTIVLYHEKYFS